MGDAVLSVFGVRHRTNNIAECHHRILNARLVRRPNILRFLGKSYFIFLFIMIYLYCVLDFVLVSFSPQKCCVSLRMWLGETWED